AARSARVERGFDPDELRFRQLDAFDRDDVEAQRSAVPLPMLHQQMPRCQNDAPALSRIDARERGHEPVAAPCPHLDDDQRRPVAADEIELAETAAIAFQQGLYPVALEI